jgi:DNA polymerase III subunit delta'
MISTPKPITDPAGHTLSSIFGHDILKQYLLGAIEQDALPHALLFSGPQGVGKTSMTYALAKLLNCGSGGPDCPGCHLCRKITERVFADILFVEPRGAAGQITLSGWKPGSDPDNLQYYRFVDTRPIEGRKKLLILQNAERMNVALANYLLKLIEEPPSYLGVVLITHRPNELLTTIRSRCSPLRFSPLSAAEMRRYASEVIGVTSEVDLNMLVQFAEGRPGRVQQLLEETGEQRRRDLAKVLRLFAGVGFPAVFGTASALLRLGKEEGPGDVLEGVLGSLQAWFRDVLLLKSTDAELASRLIVHRDVLDELRTYAEAVPMEGASEALQHIRQMYDYVGRLTDRSYLMELLLMRVGRSMRR